MKRIFTKILCLVLIVSALFSLCACSSTPKAGDLWSSATYTKDTTFGKGGKTVSVEVKAEEKSVTFTLHTNKENLGDALMEHKLISGEKGPYGIYVKMVNGMYADYDIDQSYWALTKDGESLQTAVDGTVIADGDHFEIVHIKE